MTQMLTFYNGDYRYAVNPDQIAFVCLAPNGKTRIFFSDQEDDNILVDENFDAVLSVIEPKRRR